MFPTEHLHPMIVHFPVALILVGFLFEASTLVIKKEPCLSRAGFYLLILGALAACAAYLTGQLFTSEMSGVAGDVRERHETLALLTMASMVINAVYRSYIEISKNSNPVHKWISSGLYLCSAVLVGITGFLGGNLVFKYMMPL